MNETNENEFGLDDCTQAFKEQEKQNKKKSKKKSILSRVCSKESYIDSEVYYFNKSILVGAVVLICFCLVVFFK